MTRIVIPSIYMYHHAQIQLHVLSERKSDEYDYLDSIRTAIVTVAYVDTQIYRV